MGSISLTASFEFRYEGDDHDDDSPHGHLAEMKKAVGRGEEMLHGFANKVETKVGELRARTSFK